MSICPWAPITWSGTPLPVGRRKRSQRWYSDYPDHYARDARTASEEKGQALVHFESDYLAQYIAAVKRDQVVPTLTHEFFRRVEGEGQT